jgi:predicted glycoside hydrolase/deacetylase ChbG (UPF0249 family)
MTRIWLCADDYGISPSVNAAIRDLLVRGRINATSVMVVAPSFHRAEALALQALNTTTRHVAIGLHVTLSAPFRPLSEGFRPLRDGAFPSLPALLMRACLRSLERDALTAEITRQVRSFTEHFGRPPDFIDGHQHVQLFPQVREALLAVARREAPQAWVRQCGRARAPIRALGDRKGLLLDILSQGFRRRAAAEGVRTNPAFAGTYTFGDQANFADTFPQFLDGLPDGSVVMCHPGFVDLELQKLDPLTTLREQEYAFFVQDSFPGLLARHGVALASP